MSTEIDATNDTSIHQLDMILQSDEKDVQVRG